MQNEPLHLDFFRAGQLEQSQAFKPGTYALGSGADADVRLIHPEVEDLHALLIVRGGRAVIRDVGASSGAYVNGRRVVSQELAPADLLQIGPYRVRARLPRAQVGLESLELIDSNEVYELNADPTRLSRTPSSERLRAVRLTPARGAQAKVKVKVKVTPPRNQPAPKPPKAKVARPRPREGAAELKLHLELFWGSVRREARAFGPMQKPVYGGADDLADMPLWGFTLAEKSALLAQAREGGFRVEVPPFAQVERLEGYQECRVEKEGRARHLVVGEGQGVRLVEKAMSLAVFAKAAPPPIRFNPLQSVSWLSLATLGVFILAMGTFLHFVPERSPDASTDKAMAVAVRLVLPKPEKKEEAKKKLEELKEKAEKKKEEKAKREPTEKRVAKRDRHEKPEPENRALKALSRLTVAGPATKNLFAAANKMVDLHLKDARPNALAGIMANTIASIGTPLGFGPRRGGGAVGMELLRSGSGIGAMGASSFGRAGKVGGVVGRATSRALQVQGSIDREAVARVVNAHLQEVRGCYENALLRNAGLAGKVVLEWTLSTSGAVVQSRTKNSSLKNSEVEGCILQKLKGWQFPSAKGGQVVVSYPFLFNSVGY